MPAPPPSAIPTKMSVTAGAAATSAALPSAAAASTARVVPEAMRANASCPSPDAARAASRGNVEVASGTTRTAYGSRYTCWDQRKTNHVPTLPRALATTSR